MDGTGEREIRPLVLDEFSQSDKPPAEDTQPTPLPRSMAAGPQQPEDRPEAQQESVPVSPPGSEPPADVPAEPEAPAAAPKADAAPAGAAKPLTNEEVTGHTASLWKYNPVPEDEPEPSPEYRSGVMDYPGSRVIAARVRGKKHKHEGTNCDDWYETAHWGDITFIAVSDGAGSKRFSRIGAKASCQAAAGYLVKAFAAAFADKPELSAAIKLPLADSACMDACGVLAGIVRQSVAKAREAVEAACYQRALDPAFQQILGRELELNDLSGTLLIAAIVPIDAAAKEHLIVTCQVGDGMIAALNTKGGFTSSVKLLGKPDSGDFSGETEFLTSSAMRLEETLQSRTMLFRGSVDLVMAMSDGVADDYFPNETEMWRLYFDLTANGILSETPAQPNLPELSRQQLSLFKKLPDPLAYPWVNDQSVSIALHYTNRICEALGLSLEDLWTDPALLELALLQLDDHVKAASPDERLKLWLDNYVERGSFDDRTLVIARM